MTVSDVRTVHGPRQAGPVEPPRSATGPAPAPAPVRLMERDRPRTADERQFAVGLVALFVALETFVVGGLLVAEHVWT